jgi:G patch domain-containing protein 1
MGWKIGQGIGPRLTWKKRRAQDIAAGVPASTLPDSDDEEANKHTYAPRDTPVILTERKDNSHGLGYKPGMRLDEEERPGAGAASRGPNISGTSGSFSESSEKGVTFCFVAGFGLGAQNDADEDDLDVYDGSVGRSGRHAYDIADSIDDERISMGLKADKRNVCPLMRFTLATDYIRLINSRGRSSWPKFHDRLFSMGLWCWLILCCQIKL